MTSKTSLAIACLFVILGVSCSPASTALAPTPPPFALPTLIPPTPVPPTATRVPTATNVPTAVPATATPVPATGASNPSAQATATAPSPSPTVLRATPTVASSPTAAIAAGLYVSDLRIDPAPVRGPDLHFFANFVNTSGQPQTPRWEVFIYKADTPNRVYGETSRTDAAVPVGTGEQQSNGSWKLPLGGPCDYFFAQVGYFNAENKILFFSAPSGQVFQKGFTVCPP